MCNEYIICIACIIDIMDIVDIVVKETPFEILLKSKGNPFPNPFEI